MKLYLRKNVWWARWTADRATQRRSTRTTHRDEAEKTLASWGLREDAQNQKLVHDQRYPEPMGKFGLLYFLQATGTDRIKIGFTRGHVSRRMSSIQTGCPFPLKAIATLKAHEIEERHYHKQFVAERVMPNAEWFYLSPALQVAIDAAADGRSVCTTCAARQKWLKDWKAREAEKKR